MKTFNPIIFIALLALLLFAGKTQAQEIILRSQNGDKSLNVKEASRNMFNPVRVISQSNRNKSAGPKMVDRNQAWKLYEDFESVTFPPPGWFVNSGTTEWSQANVSAFGTGNYSASYNNYACNYTSNTITSALFSPTVAGDKLIFDVAYAPNGDSLNYYFDDLDIYYYDSISSSYIFLTQISGDSLKSAPPSYPPFLPDSTQWKTISIDLPVNTSGILLQAIENCGNLLYVDNVRVGTEDPPPVLFEDFSTSFPPANWNAEPYWQFDTISAYGIGYGSVMNSIFYDCGNPNGYLTTSSFPAVANGAQLIFDYAYAPIDYFFFGDLQIFGTSDGGMNFDLIATVSGDPNGGELVTSPPTTNYFIPTNAEWANIAIGIPEGTTQLKFTLTNFCSNNLYLDNITVNDNSVITGYDAAVNAVWSKSKLPLGFGVPDTISAEIFNNSFSSVNSLMVYLQITGANNYTDSIEIRLAGNSGANVRFNPFQPVMNGLSTVTVTVGSDLNNANNSKSALLLANPDTYRYADSVCCNSAIAYTQTGSFLNKYRMNGTGQITKVRMKVYNDPLNAGQIYYGVVLDAAGNLLGRSKDFKLKASDANTFITLNITDPKPILLSNSEFYAGVLQTMSVGDLSFALSTNSEYNLPARPQGNYFADAGPVGSNLVPTELNYNLTDFMIEAVVSPQLNVDVGVSDIGLKFEQYFNTNTVTQQGKVFNSGATTASFNVTRTISPGGYVSTRTVSNLAPGSNAVVTFDPWTFSVSPTYQYTVRDSVILFGDENLTNNAMTESLTPRIAKQLCVLWQTPADRDSLIRAINADGRFANNFDTVRINFTGSLRPWNIIFGLLKSGGDYSSWMRDSMKSYLDNSTPLNKKSLLLFGDVLQLFNDPIGYYASAEDSIFFRQYLKAMTINNDWVGSVPASGNRFRGVGAFSGISQDSLYVENGYQPGFIKAVNGGTSAFKPRTVSSNDNDSSNAVCFFGGNYNTFLMTNRFSNLRATAGSSLSLGPLNVYARIIDWIQGISTSSTLNLMAFPEGFYNAGSNLMTPDTVRVILRNSSAPYAIVETAKALLSATGTASFTFSNAANNTPYYIQLIHRNSIETWSASPQSFTGGVLNFSFVSSLIQSYGNNLIQIDNSPVRFGIYGGDTNQDGTVDATDVSAIDNDAANFAGGYVATDLTGDEFVDATDFAIADNNAANFISIARP